MINETTFTREHIASIKELYKNLDQFLIERMIFAFGLLESLVKVDLPFVFKGGTSLVLLLDKPYRLSTDIDIVVEPTVDIDKYLYEVSKIYPFIRREKQERKGKNDIIKEHYKFYYQSPSSDQEIPILLDVLFENHGYDKIIKAPIQNDFLIQEGTPLLVYLPSIESILADKLTAFAPNTTGIEYEYYNKEGVLVTKYLEVIKQFLDVAKLLENATDFGVIRTSYLKIVMQEIDYRGLKITEKDTLLDTFNMSLSIITRGVLFKEDYPKLLKGIQSIQNHVFGLRITGESVVDYACNIMLLCARLIKNTDLVEVEIPGQLKFKKYKNINRLKKINADAYKKAVSALKLLELA
jgi:predicted nucleotidyltransferase component of viral defense system